MREKSKDKVSFSLTSQESQEASEVASPKMSRQGTFSPPGSGPYLLLGFLSPIPLKPSSPALR